MQYSKLIPIINVKERTVMALTKSFSKDKKKCSVTFLVSAEAAQGVKKINIAGDFNSWSSTDTPLKQGKDLGQGICHP